MGKTKRKKKRGSRPIVIGHLEKVGSGVFERYREQITGLIQRNQGVYVLYRRRKLYYIGLASDLKGRIKHHLRDRHKGKWDQFSLYIIRKEGHIREVESLLVRIAEPAGNAQRGKLRRSKNILPELKRQVKKQQEEERENLFGRRSSAQKKRKKEKVKVRRGERPLKGLLRDYQRIYANYKGKAYKAKVLPSGSIKFNDKIYNTPTGAARDIIDRGAVNGWNFWNYKDKAGNLVPLKKLRK